MKRQALSRAEISMPEPASIPLEAPLAFAEHSVEDDMANWLKSFNKK